MDIPYRSFLLRIWLEPNAPPVLRAMLENPNNGERHGFSSLDVFFTFIRQEAERLEKEVQSSPPFNNGEKLP
jgi:hypothetical protein